jgi:hypothetical protein
MVIYPGSFLEGPKLPSGKRLFGDSADIHAYVLKQQMDFTPNLSAAMVLRRTTALVDCFPSHLTAVKYNPEKHELAGWYIGAEVPDKLAIGVKPIDNIIVLGHPGCVGTLCGGVIEWYPPKEPPEDPKGQLFWVACFTAGLATSRSPLSLTRLLDVAHMNYMRLNLAACSALLNDFKKGQRGK